jgi:dienelactone hydrolase
MAISRTLVALAAAAALLLAPMPADAERISFVSAASSSGAVQIFQGEAAYTDHIYGELQLPAKGTAPFPAMVIMHSSRGVGGTIQDWAKLFNEMGIATLTVDSFTPRGLSEASAGRLTFPADVADALRALQAIQQDSRIDAQNVGIIGFSLGAIGAMGSSFERYRAAILGAEGGKYTFHIVFYGGCAQFAKTTGSPILTFVGTKDDFNNVDVCRRHTDMLNQQGTKAELVVYDGAPHGFDTDYPVVFMPMIQNYRNCALIQNMDTFEAVLLDGRILTPEERLRYGQTCPGSGASRGGDRKFAGLARERVRQFVAEQFHLPR